MKKQWEGSVYVDAPVEQVFAYLADVSRHADWDVFVERTEAVKPGDGDGIGAVWKVWEKLNVFSVGERGAKLNPGLASAKRTLKELAPHSRVVWNSRPIVAMGVNADFAFDLRPEGEGTRITESVTTHILGVMEFIGRPVAKGMDPKIQGQWQESLDRLKQAAEANARAMVAA